MLYSSLTATAERAQGGERFVTASIETGSEIGYESSQKHLLCFFTALQTRKMSKVICKE